MEGFPEAAVVASAESARFTRDRALAWSLAWVLDGAEATASAAARLAHPGFTQCFLDSVAADVDPEEGAAELLGHVATPVVGVPGGTTTRARLTAGTPEGVVVVHLDLVTLAGDRAVTLLVLADTPDPFAAHDVAAVAGRLAAHLG